MIHFVQRNLFRMRINRTFWITFYGRCESSALSSLHSTEFCVRCYISYARSTINTQFFVFICTECDRSIFICDDAWRWQRKWKSLFLCHLFVHDVRVEIRWNKDTAVVSRVIRAIFFFCLAMPITILMSQYGIRFGCHIFLRVRIGISPPVKFIVPDVLCECILCILCGCRSLYGREYI